MISYLEHVEGYLATTKPPQDTELAVASGLVGTPLLGTSTRVTVDWCHAWSLLGQWSGLVTFPVPQTGVWPRHGHLRGILNGFVDRQPNFHKWARPAYEQGALPTLSLLPGEVTIRVLPGDKMYQAMEIEPGYMRPVILHGFGTSAKQRLPGRLTELAQRGWLPLAAALFGTAEWKPQWLHHNFLPVIGLRVHARIAPPPITKRQMVSLLGLWERSNVDGIKCLALSQAVDLSFGLPSVFSDGEAWEMNAQGQMFDVVQCSQGIFTGQTARESPNSKDRPQRWANWVFSLPDVWQEDETMPDRPVMVHCSGLGGGLLSPDHEYDIFFQNHAQMKVYGPSLAMMDDWEHRVTQLGLTKSVHEYAVYQLLATAIGWKAWQIFVSARFADHKLLLSRAIRLVTATDIRPAHSRPPHPTWTTAVRQIMRCYHPQGKLLLLRSSFPHLVTVPMLEGCLPMDILGFSAGSYTGLAVHAILNEFRSFPGATKVAAVAAPPAMLRLATGERKVTLIHCTEDKLCVWQPESLDEVSYSVVLIEGTPVWAGRSKHAYGHLLFTNIEDGTYQIDQLQVTHPEVLPHALRSEGLLRVLSWVSFDLPDSCKNTLSALLQAAGQGCLSLHTVPIEGRDVRDDPIESEAALQAALIAMVPVPGQASSDGGQLIQGLLVEFLKGFSLRTLIFLLDMVLPQLDAYHSGRRLQHLQSWVCVELTQQRARNQQGTRFGVRYRYEAYAQFHVLQLVTEGAPVLLFCDPTEIPRANPWALCEAGALGSMESNVMAGRALLGIFQLQSGLRRCAVFIVQEKVMQGTSKAAAYRAYRRIAPKHLELIVVSGPVAREFCGRLLQQHASGLEYFDPREDWPQPIEYHMLTSLVLEQLFFLGDTRSRYELQVFAHTNAARLPLTMGILQPGIPVRRMSNDRKTQLTDALVRILRRFLTPATIELEGEHDQYMRDRLLALAGHGDGHVLTVLVAVILAVLTGRSDLCIAGVFGAGKTRSLAVLLIALSCEIKEFSAVIYTKENVAAKALADQISDFAPPTQIDFGRLLGRIEEGKGEAYASKIDVRCSDRNRIIANKRILIATGGSATAEMSMRYSCFGQWLSRVWMAFMDG